MLSLLLQDLINRLHTFAVSVCRLSCKTLLILHYHMRQIPPPPENPMSADRVRWEHIQRVYELCDRNVSETARRLNMHRRTLQRILAKRSPK